ncbi:ABC transporter substrate-binding protein [Noviherbaspirillum sp. UKPF54]|uniref:ABC transporter substrate-binding protein n=1 Tax=Noviherbaspirillum sp. UKPF54 TaxID=2601898 RepID=UPI0011B16D87|nr:ABC transporter substrate-binding protein [Noviherbaspirillum sp. UKPF54]QDZ27529.1 amino acid ABC transporter substrate-binding protein [Noviherbaspirillum sp. UKPF54]
MFRSTHALRCCDWLSREFAGLACAVASLLFAACGEAQARIELGAPADQADAVVGCMFPLTGWGALYGRDSIGGIKVALADLQADLGAKDAPKLRILVEDDRSKASFAQRIAEDYVRRDHARFLCGIVSSGVAQAVSRVARERGVLMIGTDHASSRLTIEEFHRYYFRLSNDTYTSMAAGARYLADLQKKAGWKRLVFLGSDYDYGHIAWRDLKGNLDRLGVKYTVAGEYWTKLYEPDYSTYIEQVAKTGADVAVVGLWGGDFVTFLKQAVSSGLNAKMRIANFDTGGSYDTLVSLGEQAPTGLILSGRHHNNWPDTARNRKFVADFHRLEGRYPTYVAEGAYSGIVAMGRALAIAGKHATTDKLIATLEGLRLNLPEDPEGYSSWIDPNTHQIVQAQAIGEVVPNHDFPPAQVMLSNWTVYPAEALRPPAGLIQERRARARAKPPAVQPPPKEK